MPGACARAFLSFLVLACGRWGSAAPPWALVVVAVPRYRERPLFCASAPSVSRPSPMHRPWRRRPLACRSFMSVSRASPSGAVPYAGSVWGFCTTRGCDTPATRRQRASCSAKPPSHQIGDRAGRNSRRRRCGVRGIVWARLLTKVPPHQVASSPSGLLTKWPPPQGVAKATSPQISHAIPRRCESTQAQKPRNFNDPTSKPETFSGELHAKLLDTALSAPRKVARNSSRASFDDSSKTAEFQRSNFNI